MCELAPEKIREQGLAPTKNALPAAVISLCGKVAA
jgi:hypothetical protein